MRLNRLNANPEERRNLFRVLPLRGALQYFALSKRELLQFRIDISRLFPCRGDVGYLDPLPDSVSNRNRELVCARRVENLLGPAPRERKGAGCDHSLFRQEIFDLLLELTKAAQPQIDLHPGGTSV